MEHSLLIFRRLELTHLLSSMGPKMKKIYGLLLLTATLAISCKHTDLPETQSNLSEVNFSSNVAKSDQFYEMLGGKANDCPLYKGNGGCDGASAFLTYYRAEFKSQTCRDKTAKGKDSVTDKSVTLEQSCSYNLKLSYKESDNAESCFEGSQEFLIRIGQKQVEINQIIEPTDYCIKKGFPDIKVTLQNAKDDTEDSTSATVNTLFPSNNYVSMDTVLNLITESRALHNSDYQKSLRVLSRHRGKWLNISIKLRDIHKNSNGENSIYYFELVDSKQLSFLSDNNLTLEVLSIPDLDSYSDTLTGMQIGETYEVTTVLNSVSRYSADNDTRYTMGIYNHKTTYTKK